MRRKKPKRLISPALSDWAAAHPDDWDIICGVGGAPMSNQAFDRLAPQMIALECYDILLVMMTRWMDAAGAQRPGL